MSASASRSLTHLVLVISSTTMSGTCLPGMCMIRVTNSRRLSWKPIVENIEARFDSYLEQENRVNRQKIVDNRVHACLYFIQPTGHS